MRESGENSAPPVTIVTPSFNQGQFIRATIESVLSQDYPNLEYIIMDGGSTDQTADVVRDYSSRVTWISEKDRGQSHAINKGFRMARGIYAGWLNSDDVLLPGAIRSALCGFRANPHAGAVYGEGYLIDKNGNVTGRFPWTETFNLWRLMYLSDYVLQQGALFRKDLLEEIGYLREDLHYAMDWDLLIRIAKRAPLEYVPEYLGCLREYPEAKTASGGGKRIAEVARVLREHTGKWLPPGLIVYGLDTYRTVACNWLEEGIPWGLKTLALLTRFAVAVGCDQIVRRQVDRAQGIYRDRWAQKRAVLVLPPGAGAIYVEGMLPDSPWLKGQTLEVRCGAEVLGEFPVFPGMFRVEIQVPGRLCRESLLRLEVRASHSLTVYDGFDNGLEREVCYKFLNAGWTGPDRACGAAATT